jgi:hypothetical protein
MDTLPNAMEIDDEVAQTEQAANPEKALGEVATMNLYYQRACTAGGAAAASAAAGTAAAGTAAAGMAAPTSALLSLWYHELEKVRIAHSQTIRDLHRLAAMMHAWKLRASAQRLALPLGPSCPSGSVSAAEAHAQPICTWHDISQGGE